MEQRIRAKKNTEFMFATVKREDWIHKRRSKNRLLN